MKRIQILAVLGLALAVAAVAELVFVRAVEAPQPAASVPATSSTASAPEQTRSPVPLAPIRIGAVFPLDGDAAALSRAELAGVQIAADTLNAAGGAAGHAIALDVRDLSGASEAASVVASLKAAGASVIVGTYSSDLSMAVSSAAAAAGLVYWEAGSVADRLTGRGLPSVFRVGASGSNLGDDSSTFAAQELAPRLGKSAGRLRVAVVNADDDYATSVADAAVRTAAVERMPVVARLTYNLSVPDWPRVMADLKSSHPDVVILASHIADGIAFRRAMIVAGFKVG